MMENNIQQPLAPGQQIDQLNPVSPKTSYHPSKTFIVLMVVFLNMTVGLGGYILGTNQNQIAQNQNQPVPPITQPSPAPDPTANWKTYTNNKYGYAIKYPDKYTPYGFDSNRNLLPNNINNENASYVMFRDQPIPPEYYDQLPHALWIAVMNSKEFEDSKEKLGEAVKKAPCAGCPTKSKASINGIDADVYNGYGGSYSLDKVILMQHGENFFYLSFPLTYKEYDPSIGDQILSTFQFTNP